MKGRQQWQASWTLPRPRTPSRALTPVTPPSLHTPSTHSRTNHTQAPPPHTQAKNHQSAAALRMSGRVMPPDIRSTAAGAHETIHIIVMAPTSRPTTCSVPSSACACACAYACACAAECRSLPPPTGRPPGFQGKHTVHAAKDSRAPHPPATLWATTPWPGELRGGGSS